MAFQLAIHRRRHSRNAFAYYDAGAKESLATAHTSLSINITPSVEPSVEPNVLIYLSIVIIPNFCYYYYYP